MRLSVNLKKVISFSLVSLFVASSFSALSFAEESEKVLLPVDVEWSYNDEGIDLGTEWIKEDYDITDWKTGIAPIGFGDAVSETNPEVLLGTEIGYGDDEDNKYMTTYAITKIDVESLDEYEALEIYVHVDDGAVVYFNGQEAFRKGIDAEEEVNYNTPAKFSKKEEILYLPVEMLKSGVNTISAEIHQDGGDSSDLWFEMSITGLREAPVIIDYTKTPIPNTEVEVGDVSRVVVSMKGDTKTEKGFTWYTSQASANSDLQIIEKTDLEEPDFSNAFTFAGTYLRSTNAPEYVVHKADATGLEPGTEYQFRVGDASLDLWSDTGSFKTADDDGKFSFIDLADTQAKTEIEAELSADTFEKASDTVKDSEFIIINGDIVDAGIIEEQWGWVFDAADSTLLNTTLVGVAGNHDEDPMSFIEHFNLDTPTGSSTETGAYYSYNYENTHFIVLNNNEDSEEFRNFSVEQINWLKEDVAIANADENIDWIIAVMHKGPYTTSNHATDEDIMGTNGVREIVPPLFYELGIDLVLQGHDHIYARTKPIANGVAVEAEKVLGEYNGNQVEYSVNTEGTVYMIPSTAGPKVYYKNTEIEQEYYDLFEVANEHSAAQYGQDPSDPSRPVRSQIQNFVEFNIDGTKLTAIVYEIDQSKNDGEPYIIDSFGLMNTLEEETEEMPKTGDSSMGIMLVAGSILALLGVIIASKTKIRKA